MSTICSLCLKQFKNKFTYKITQRLLGKLKDIFINLDNKTVNNTWICECCRTKLNLTHNFKTLIRNSDRFYCSKKLIQEEVIDLTSNAEQPYTVPEIRCRLCMKETKDICMYLYENMLNEVPFKRIEKMIKALHAIDFMATYYPVLCTTCWTILEITHDFRVTTEHNMNIVIDNVGNVLKNLSCFKELRVILNQLPRHLLKQSVNDFEDRDKSPELKIVKNNKENTIKQRRKKRPHVEILKESVRPVESNSYTCLMCNFSTNGQGFLMSHEYTSHLSINNYMYTCPKCSYICNNRERLKDHLISHDTRNKFTCPLCPFESEDVNIYNQHESYHKKAKKMKKFKCIRCRFQTNVRLEIRKHMIEHKRTKFCKFCSFKSNYKSKIRQHVLMSHKNEFKI